MNMHKLVLLNAKINEITAEIKRWVDEINCITNYIRRFPENSDCVPLECLVEKYRAFAQEKVAEYHQIHGEYTRLITSRPPAPAPAQQSIKLSASKPVPTPVQNPPPIYPMTPRANRFQLPACPKINIHIPLLSSELIGSSEPGVANAYHNPLLLLAEIASQNK